MALINFKLKGVNEIIPFSDGENLSLHWFGLTDGDLWIELSTSIIFEYTDEALRYFGEKKTSYNDYYLSRFIEDFTELFPQVRESIPENIYHSFDNFISFHSFLNETTNWLQKSDDDDEDFYENKYCNLTSWIDDRNLNSGHLIGGPNMWFFRCGNKIKIIWNADHKMENGQKMWTSPNGLVEINYSDFKKEIKLFGERFYNEMGNQVQIANDKDFGKIKIDKTRLVEEHKERKLNFFNALNKLDEEKQIGAWDLVENLIKEMRQK